MCVYDGRIREDTSCQITQQPRHVDSPLGLAMSDLTAIYATAQRKELGNRSSDAYECGLILSPVHDSQPPSTSSTIRTETMRSPGKNAVKGHRDIFSLTRVLMAGFSGEPR